MLQSNAIITVCPHSNAREVGYRGEGGADWMFNSYAKYGAWAALRFRWEGKSLKLQPKRKFRESNAGLIVGYQTNEKSAVNYGAYVSDRKPANDESIFMVRSTQAATLVRKDCRIINGKSDDPYNFLYEVKCDGAYQPRGDAIFSERDGSLVGFADIDANEIRAQSVESFVAGDSRLKEAFVPSETVSTSTSPKQTSPASALPPPGATSLSAELDGRISRWSSEAMLCAADRGERTDLKAFGYLLPPLATIS